MAILACPQGSAHPWRAHLSPLQEATHLPLPGLRSIPWQRQLFPQVLPLEIYNSNPWSNVFYNIMYLLCNHWDKYPHYFAVGMWLYKNLHNIHCSNYDTLSEQCLCLYVVTLTAAGIMMPLTSECFAHSCQEITSSIPMNHPRWVNLFHTFSSSQSVFNVIRVYSVIILKWHFFHNPQ